MGGDITGLARVITPAGDAMMLELLDRLGRQRALSEDESRLVEILVRRTARAAPTFTHQWTQAEDRELLRVQFRPRGVIIFAERIGVTEKAARRRLEKLIQRKRNQGKSQGAPQKVER